MRKFLSMLIVLLGLTLFAFSQPKIITGRVTDVAGLPVPFASVRIKGTKIGVSADADGSFSIKAKEGETLIISGTGVTNKEVPVVASGAMTIVVEHHETS